MLSAEFFLDIIYIHYDSCYISLCVCLKVAVKVMVVKSVLLLCHCVSLE